MRTAIGQHPAKPDERVFIGLGSNLGDRQTHLENARTALEARGLRIAGISSIYETAALGPVEQADFLNQVLEVDNAPDAVELLEICLDIESELGRVRNIDKGPRTIDLDLLLYGSRRLESPTLILPHPRMAERLFVLAPLAELAPNVRHPVLGATMAELRDRLVEEGEQRVSILEAS